MNELSDIRSFVKRYGNELVIVPLATLSLILFRYHSLGSLVLRYAVFFVAIPTAGLLLLKRNPLDMGLRLGDLRRWSIHVLAACALAILLVVIGSRLGSVSEYYGTKTGTGILQYIAERIVIIFAIEYMFRGFLLFGLKEKLGEGAILFQMVPFAILHIGKPEIEAVGCILAGLYFGYLAYRTGSIWPCFIIHLIANTANYLLHVLKV